MLRRTCVHMGSKGGGHWGGGAVSGFGSAISFGEKIGFAGIAFVPTGATGVVETFGKFSHTVSPGLRFYVPFVQRLRKVTNMVHQAEYDFECKTRDNIFIVLTVAAQVFVAPEQSADALYKVASPLHVIHSFLDSEVRAQVSKRDLDKLFTEQEEVSQSVFSRHGGKQSVSEKLEKLGFTVTEVLIRHIDPAQKVKESMNEINASLRLRDAAANKADASYILAIKEAEADRDRKRLQGEGISQQRLAILKGYEEGIDQMSSKFGITPQQVIDFVMRTQHLDTLAAIGKSNGCKTLFLSHDPASATRVIGTEQATVSAGGGGPGLNLQDLLTALEATSRSSSPPAAKKQSEKQ